MDGVFPKSFSTLLYDIEISTFLIWLFQDTDIKNMLIKLVLYLIIVYL
jgi:hypothetical protein